MPFWGMGKCPPIGGKASYKEWLLIAGSTVLHKLIFSTFTDLCSQAMFNPYSAGIEFSRQSLTSVDVRSYRAGVNSSRQNLMSVDVRF